MKRVEKQQFRLSKHCWDIKDMPRLPLQCLAFILGGTAEVRLRAITSLPQTNVRLSVSCQLPEKPGSTSGL